MSGGQPSLNVAGGSSSLGYFVGGNSRNGLAPSPATSTTSSQHCIGPYKSGGPPNGPINGNVNEGGFAPEHPLAKNDGRRHYGSRKHFSYLIFYIYLTLKSYLRIYIYIYIYIHYKYLVAPNLNLKQNFGK